MTVKHTPGPWRLGNGTAVVADAGGPGTWDDADNVRFYGGPLICESVRSIETARLIAAAPDLLAALERAFEFLDANFDEADMADILIPCREALGRARGSPPAELDDSRAGRADQWTEDELAEIRSRGPGPVMEFNSITTIQPRTILPREWQWVEA